MTREEWGKLMERCATHNDFFKPHDLQRNAIWYSKLPKTLTYERAVIIVDNYYANNKGNIGLFAFHEALAAERQELVAETRRLATARQLGFMGLPWPTDISDKNLERLKQLKSGMRFPLSDEWTLSENEKLIEARNAVD
jgi:hypothetical protein